MAESLSRSGAIRTLEEALSLLREASLRLIVLHWIGSVPFALGLMLAWGFITGPRASDAAWAGLSLILALLLVWMNCWRAVFAGRLRGLLSGSPDSAWGPRRVFEIAAIQGFSAATKLIVLPFSMLIVFPWAATIAFYRGLAMLVGSRTDLAPRRLMQEARRLSGFQLGQSWILLALLLLLGAILTVNLALALAVLPQLVRMLTGFESEYSRSGIAFIENPAFLLLTLVVSWLAFDPFVQAVYCVRCFQAESRATGEDLLSGLRRIGATIQAPAALLLLTVIAVPLARADIAPDDLKKSTAQAMQSPEYDWRLPAPTNAVKTPTVFRVVDRIVAALRQALKAIGRLIRRLLDWLFPEQSSASKGAPPGAGLSRTIVALIVLVLATAGLFAWQRQRSRGARSVASAASPSVVHLEADGLTPDALPEDRWIELADQCLAEHNFRLALRALYLGCLAWLGRREILSIHPGKTNHEYETELRRRTRGIPQAITLFAGNVTAFERAWYGLHPVTVEETAEFRQRTSQLKAALPEPQQALPGGAA